MRAGVPSLLHGPEECGIVGWAAVYGVWVSLLYGIRYTQTRLHVLGLGTGRKEAEPNEAKYTFYI